jgi:endonuclease III
MAFRARWRARSARQFWSFSRRQAKVQLMAQRAPKHVEEIARALSLRYHDDAHRNRKNPFEELLFILCSIQTNSELYSTTFALLRRAYPRFDDVADAPPREIARVLRGGGLHRQKATTVSRIAKSLRAKYGRVTLAPLHRAPALECETLLVSLPGVGKKTARCVMMYSLGLAVFPVDTHCWRVCRRLGWVRATRPNGSCSPADMDRLQNRIPSEHRHTLHINMVSLGRDVCTARRPRCYDCPIEHFCPRLAVATRPMRRGQS